METLINNIDSSKKITVLLFFISALIETDLKAQKNNSQLGGDPLDIDMHVIPYPYLREADVMWNTRIWRTIDLREKMNHSLYFPLEPYDNQISLFDALVKGIEEGNIVAFNDLYDDMRIQLTRAEVSAILKKPKAIQQENPDLPGTYTTIFDTVKISSKDVIEYIIKEDCFFDKQRSVMETRIIGICPVVKTYDETTGAERGKTKLFWLYYPNCRVVLVGTKAFNRQNQAQSAMISFDEIFWKRMFSSYITKQSNVYDRPISEYENGLDLLLEGEKIKDEIFNLEMDLWHY